MSIGLLLRSLHHPIVRRYRWQFSPRYWAWRQRWRTAVLHFRRTRYKWRETHRVTRESASILAGILVTIRVHAFLAIVLVALATMLDMAVLDPDAGLWRRVPEPGILRDVLSRLQEATPDAEARSNMYGTAAGVAGVFLGLYFTAVSVVASTTYARLPEDVRRLLTREKVGNLYIGAVSVLAAVALSFLALQAVGYNPGLVSLALTAGLAVVAVLSFVVLGQRTFHFFDPARLVEPVAYDLYQLMHAVTSDGVHWNDPAFQQHYQQKAMRLLTTYHQVIAVTLQEAGTPGATAARLADRLLTLLEAYGTLKPRIPRDSRWYLRTLEHRAWATASASELELAEAMAMPLRPREVPDWLWVEVRIGRILGDISRALADRGQWEDLATIADRVQDTFHALGMQFAVDEALQVLRWLRPTLFDQARKAVVPSPGARVSEEVRAALAVVDCCGLALLQILLGLSQRLQEMRVEAVAERVDEIPWERPGEIYRRAVPLTVVEQFEAIHAGLEFEHAVEGRSLTPPWYLRQRAALGFAEFLAASVPALMHEFRATFGDGVRVMLADGQSLAAGQFLVRGLEVSEKLPRHLDSIQGFAEALLRLRRTDDDPWPDIDWAGLRKEVHQLRTELAQAMVRAAPELASWPAGPELPDYFGFCSTTLARTCHAALVERQPQLFQAIFPPFVDVAIQAYERTREHLQGEDPVKLFLLMTDPLVDLLELSGYALIYGDLDGQPYFQTVTAAWDRALDSQSDPAEACKWIAQVLRNRDDLLWPTPRDIVRSSWSRQLQARLRAAGLASEVLDPYPTEAGQRHPSPVVRICARRAWTSPELADLFVIRYLRQRPGCSDIPLTRRGEDLAESLEREEAKQDNVAEADGEPSALP